MLHSKPSLYSLLPQQHLIWGTISFQGGHRSRSAGLFEVSGRRIKTCLQLAFCTATKEPSPKTLERLWMRSEGVKRRAPRAEGSVQARTSERWVLIGSRRRHKKFPP